MSEEINRQFEALSKLGSDLGANLAINDVLQWANKYAELLSPQARKELISIAEKYVPL